MCKFGPGTDGRVSISGSSTESPVECNFEVEMCAGRDTICMSCPKIPRSAILKANIILSQYLALIIGNSTNPYANYIEVSLEIDKGSANPFDELRVKCWAIEWDRTFVLG
jgi:hypothetical protein